MKKLIFTIPAVLFLLAFGLTQHAWAQYDDPVYYDNSSLPADALLAPEELDDLLAPIALYPDPLLAQMLPASTFVDQIDQAARYIRQYGSGAPVDNMPWDISVRALAHYPDVLFMMDQKYDWTVALGQAYINQPQDVMDAIQRLRAEARAEGNLYTTAQQQVVVEDDNIAIWPASPEYVYVPVYDPGVVYYEPYDPAFPFITFGLGFVVGAWLDRDCDWRHHRVFYHGWRDGGGWVARSRPHIRDRRGIYTGRQAATISVNRQVLRHDTRDFREQLRTETVRRREGRPLERAPRPGQPGERERFDRQRGPEGRGGGEVERRAPDVQRRSPEVERRAPAAAPVTGGTAPAAARPTERPAFAAPRPATPAPAAAARPVAAPAQATAPATVRTGRGPQMRPGTEDIYRGRDVQRTQPASQSGYGGYGTGRDAASYSRRGAASRQIMNQPVAAPRPAFTPRVSAPSAPRSAPAPRASAPTPRASAPAGRPAAPMMQRR